MLADSIAALRGVKSGLWAHMAGGKAPVDIRRFALFSQAEAKLFKSQLRAEREAKQRALDAQPPPDKYSVDYGPCGRPEACSL